MDSILPSLDEYAYDAQKCVSRSAHYFLNKANVIITALFFCFDLWNKTDMKQRIYSR